MLLRHINRNSSKWEKYFRHFLSKAASLNHDLSIFLLQLEIQPSHFFPPRSFKKRFCSGVLTRQFFCSVPWLLFQRQFSAWLLFLWSLIFLGSIANIWKDKSFWTRIFYLFLIRVFPNTFKCFICFVLSHSYRKHLERELETTSVVNSNSQQRSSLPYHLISMVAEIAPYNLLFAYKHRNPSYFHIAYFFALLACH